MFLGAENLANCSVMKKGFPRFLISNSWKQSRQAVQQIYLLVNGSTNLFDGCWKEQREELTKGKERGKYTSERNNSSKLAWQALVLGLLFS